MLVIPVFILGMDSSEDEEEELKSMEDRKKYLEEKYLVKCEKVESIIDLGIIENPSWENWLPQCKCHLMPIRATFIYGSK